MLIRNFSPTDLGNAMRMVAENFMQDYSPSMYISLHMYWPDGFIVAAEEERLMGFLLGSINRQHEARILIMVVDPTMRNRGIGTAVLNEFINRCRLKGMTKLVLEVRASNKKAFDFYAKHGFQFLSRMPNHYLDGEDGVTMEKWL